MCGTCGELALCRLRSLLLSAENAPVGVSDGRFDDVSFIGASLLMGEAVPGLCVETFGLNVTERFPAAFFFEGAGGTRGVVSVLGGIVAVSYTHLTLPTKRIV